MPDNYGSKRDCDKYIPVMMTLPSVPETTLQLIKCDCSKSVFETSRVSTKLTNLSFCGAEENPCENIASEQYAYDF